MNKLLLFVSVFFAASIFVACDKTKTYYELEKEERKAISRFMNENDFHATNNPKEMYNENVYFKTKEGLYINVIDSGPAMDRVKTDQEVAVRFESYMFFKNDTTKKLGNMHAGNDAYTFIYGRAYTNNFACDGWAIGLALVNNKSRVNLIIPSSLQPYNMQNSFEPMFYENLYYWFN